MRRRRQSLLPPINGVASRIAAAADTSGPAGRLIAANIGNYKFN